MTTEQQAIAAVLTDQLRHDLKYTYALENLVWQALDALGVEDDDALYERLYDLLASGKWRVVYVEDTP